MSAVFLILLLLPAGAGVCAVARCQLAEGLAVAMLGLVAAGYLLALAGLLPLLGLLPWAIGLCLLFPLGPSADKIRYAPRPPAGR